MATPSTRNLVLLLISGHTVRIALREHDLTDPGTQAVFHLLDSMPAVCILPGDIRQGGAVDNDNVEFAYIEDPSLPKMLEKGGGFEPPSDLQRITVEGPGTVVQYG